ncbi:hypothetical protein LTS12_027679, partial [Elasticomyces elasticus]
MVPTEYIHVPIPSEKGEDDHVNPTVTLDWRPSKQEWIVIACQICVVLLVSLDSTILTNSLPSVSGALDADATGAFWTLSAYLLASTSVQPVVAALASIFGRKTSILAALAMFTFGTVLCSSARSLQQMLAGRAIQGVGGGAILSLNLIILSEAIPLRQRPKYMGMVQIFSFLAVNLGPLIGAALAEKSWRWLFYINFPFCGAALAAILYCMRNQNQDTKFFQKLNEIDWVGSIAFILGV